RERVGAHLHALVRKRLIFPADAVAFASEDSFQFAHILVRDAAYGALPKARRAELHETFANWLARKTSESGGDYSESIGHHLEQQFMRLLTSPEGSSSQIRALTERVIPELEALGDDLGLARAWWLASEVHTSACLWGARAAALERAIEHAGRADDGQLQATLIA